MRNKAKIFKNALIISAYMCLHDWGRKKNKKRPSFRVNPYLKERHFKGRFNTDFADMRKNPRIFSENFHMDVKTFDELFVMVEEDLLPIRNVRPDAISPMQKLALTIEYLASGSIPRHMASVYRISPQHVGTIIQKVCSALCLKLSTYLLKFEKEELVDVAKGFENRWQFPNCVGAMDGKHIALEKPSNSGSLFYNYKGFHSIVLFAVADWRYKIIYFDIGAYGSEGDANIFSNSEFGKAVIDENIDFPEHSVINGERIPFFFIGDDAFPLGKRIMKPYGGKNLKAEEIIFNYRLSRARRCVENAFGILSIKWLCLKRTMFCSPERAQKIVAACCLLHNFLLERSSSYCGGSLPDSVDSAGDIIDGEFRKDVEKLPTSSLINARLDPFRGRQCDVGKRIRDKIKNFVNSPEGAVAWQRQATFLK